MFPLRLQFECVGLKNESAAFGFFWGGKKKNHRSMHWPLSFLWFLMFQWPLLFLFSADRRGAQNGQRANEWKVADQWQGPGLTLATSWWPGGQPVEWTVATSDTGNWRRLFTRSVIRLSGSYFCPPDSLRYRVWPWPAEWKNFGYSSSCA